MWSPDIHCTIKKLSTRQEMTTMRLNYKSCESPSKSICRTNTFVTTWGGDTTIKASTWRTLEVILFCQHCIDLMSVEISILQNLDSNCCKWPWFFNVCTKELECFWGLTNYISEERRGKGAHTHKSQEERPTFIITPCFQTTKWKYVAWEYSVKETCSLTSFIIYLD